MTFSYSTMNPNSLVCPAMEPSYSQDSMDSMFSYPAELLATSPESVGLSSGQTVFDPTFFGFSPSSHYPITDMYPVPNTDAIPIPGPQFPYYSRPGSFNSFSTPSSPSSPSSSPPSVPPLQWTPGDEPFLGLSPGVRGSPPEASSKSVKPFPCKDCGKAFTRSADLKRHQTSVHYPVFQDCPVKDCSRKDRNGFPRKDHLVEHLRSYHHLSVPKRRALKRNARMHCF